MEERLVRAGLAYVVTEYADVAEKMEQLDTERAYHGERTRIAKHKASLMAHRWAMLNQLPLGGADFLERTVVSAAEYRAAHDDDVQEWLTAHNSRVVEVLHDKLSQGEEAQ